MSDTIRRRLEINYFISPGIVPVCTVSWLLDRGIEDEGDNKPEDGHDYFFRTLHNPNIKYFIYLLWAFLMALYSASVGTYCLKPVLYCIISRKS